MAATESVSKGIFAFRSKFTSKKSIPPNPLNTYTREAWHEGYTKVWGKIEKNIEKLDKETTDSLLEDLAQFVLNAPPTGQKIPTAAILTGINLPDHNSLFCWLKDKLKQNGITGIATLHSSDCASIKHTIERTVIHLMSQEILSDSEEESEVELKRSQNTLPKLVQWYSSSKMSSKLVIILQDFETFPVNILHDFIHIIREKLPFVLVFGVATTVTALSDSLSYKTSSRLDLKAFQSLPSVYFLNNTLNKIFLDPSCPFQLSGKLFKFFTNVFLFYDFSVNRFVRGIKYTVLEHFREGQNPVALLCCFEKNLEKNVEKLKNNDLKWIRELKSFKTYIDSKSDRSEQETLLNDDRYTKKELFKLMTNLRTSIKQFYESLQLLHILVDDLPQAPLGKQFRELYCIAMANDVSKTKEFKECRTLLGFMAKEQLVEKLTKCLDFAEETPMIGTIKIRKKLENLKESIANIGMNSKSPTKSPKKTLNLNIKSRSQLRQKLAELAITKDRTEYEILRDSFIDLIFIELSPYRKPFTNCTLWEIVTLIENDSRHRVVPRTRAPIHTALSNPAHYLMCECCKLNSESDILKTMPDICIAYKLHLECGTLINMYDWLQSFNLILNPEQDIEEISEQTQARFTQAVSELEFLGFIKSSKKKADHVQRLTWGGSARV